MKTAVLEKVSNVRKEDSGEWHWTITDWEGRQRNFWTNKNGEGIFSQPTPGQFPMQHTGTSQFSLAGYSVSGARRKIRRHFTI